MKVMLHNRLLSRRGLLRNAALMGLLAPVLRRRDAHAAGTPRRVVLIYSGNGPSQALGPVTGTEVDFTFHDWGQPLARHRNDGIVLSHMAATGCGVVGGNNHGIGGQSYSGHGAEVWWNKNAASLARLKNLAVIDIDPASVTAVTALLERGMRLTAMIQDGELQLMDTQRTVALRPSVRMASTRVTPV